MQEENDNAEKLAKIAGDIASAKEATDAIIEDFRNERDALSDAIQERLDSFFTIE